MRPLLVRFAASLAIAGAAKVTLDADYTADGVACRGFVAYNSSVCTATSKCPAVVIVQDWNGMNDYEKERACMIADMGYVAFAADIYGINTPKATMNDWMAASSAHNNNATKYMKKIHGAFTKLLTYDFVDSSKLAAMGYCFGGTGMVNLAMVGHSGFPGVQFPSGLLGVVSFHGGLSRGYSAPVTGTRPKLLLHSGGKDDTNADIEKLTDHLENVSAVYEINRYGPSVVHSFTEWSANSPGRSKYDAMADQRSWEATGEFLKELFAGQVSTAAAPSLSTLPSGYQHENVSYVADGVSCLGYMVYNTNKCTASSKCPAVVIVHAWGGMSDYEKKRARMIADEGYVAFAADIYGVNTPKATMNDWRTASSAHRSNATMYMKKIHGAFTKLLTFSFVDSSKLAALGYCFGGTGMVNLAMVGHSGISGVTFPSGLLGVVSFHGGLSSGYSAPVAGTRPKLLLHSGGKDDSNADISKLTDNLENVSASYEITRYGPNVLHSFTHWGTNSPGRAKYNTRADGRSWQDTMSFFKEIFAGGSLGTAKPAQCKMDGSTTAGNKSTTAASAAGATKKVSGDVEFKTPNCAACKLIQASTKFGTSLCASIVSWMKLGTAFASTCSIKTTCSGCRRRLAEDRRLSVTTKAGYAVTGLTQSQATSASTEVASTSLSSVTSALSSAKAADNTLANVNITGAKAPTSTVADTSSEVSAASLAVAKTSLAVFASMLLGVCF